jgi:hypothetical protein
MDRALRDLVAHPPTGPAVLDAPVRRLLREHVEGLLTAAWLEQRLTALDEWVARESLPEAVTEYGDRPADTNPLVAMLWAVRLWERAADAGAVDTPPLVQRWQRFALGLARAEQQAAGWNGEPARAYLSRRLQDDPIAGGLIHEIETFVDLEQRGVVATPSFLQRGRRGTIDLTGPAGSATVRCLTDPWRAGGIVPWTRFVRLVTAVGRGLIVERLSSVVTVTLTAALRDADIPVIRDQAVAVARLPVAGRYVRREPRYVIAVADAGATPPTSTAPRFAARFATTAAPSAGRVLEPRAERATVTVELRPTPMPECERLVRVLVGRTAARIDATGRPGIAAVQYPGALAVRDAHGSGALAPWAKEAVRREYRLDPWLAGVLIASDADLAAPEPAGTVQRLHLRPDLPAGFPLPVRGRSDAVAAGVDE